MSPTDGISNCGKKGASDHLSCALFTSVSVAVHTDMIARSLPRSLISRSSDEHRTDPANELTTLQRNRQRQNPIDAPANLSLKINHSLVEYPP